MDDRGDSGSAGRARSLASAPPVPRAAVHDEVAAVFSAIRARSIPTSSRKFRRDASHEVAALGDAIAFNAVAAMTELRSEIFINTDGTLISQAYAFSQGDCYVVAQIGDGHQEIYDTIGQQRGLECLADGWRDELMPNP